jgi:uncharacterized protein YoxC
MLTRDILYISLSVAALVGVAFWAILLYEIIKIMRSIEQTVREFHDRLKVIDEILQSVRDKLSSTHVQLAALAEGVKQLIGFFVRRRSASRSSSRASQATDDF